MFAMPRLSALCALAISWASVALALSSSEIADHFQRSLSPQAGVFTGSDIGSETTPRWTIYRPPDYIVGVTPATEDDVQSIMQYAHQNKIPFLATGGGHGYSTTFGDIQNGIEMDLRQFNSVHVDADANTMTVGGANTFANLTEKIYQAGKEFPVGSCSCVGIVGATLGGGIGPYGSLHGLISDSLLSARIITGTGKLLTVSAHEHPDLFWGLRGAGFNYGVVTSATFRVYDQTHHGQVMNADFIFPGETNGTLFEFMRSFQGDQPDALSMDFGIAYNEMYGGAYMLVNIIYVGPLSEGKKLIKPLDKLHALKKNITMIPADKLEKAARFGLDALSCVKGTRSSVYSINLYNLDVPTLSGVFNYLAGVYAKEPAVQHAIMALVKYAGRVTQSKPDGFSAYPWRATEAYVHFDIPVTNSSTDALASRIGNTVRGDLLKTAGSNGDLQVYVNYARGDEGKVSWYSKRKLGRLEGLKRRYDPKGLFSFFNTL